MKFAKYLRDTQTPEWKKAYIDYRKLKVQLKVIRSDTASSSLKNMAVTHVHYPTPLDEEKHTDIIDINTQALSTLPADNPSTAIVCPLDSETDHSTKCTTDTRGHRTVPSTKLSTNHEQRTSLCLNLSIVPPRQTGKALYTQSLENPRLSVSSTEKDFECSALFPLFTTLPHLPAIHAKFFDMLDAELAKIETFYVEREKQMHEHDKLLMKQLDELSAHSETLHKSSTHAKKQSWFKRGYRVHVAPGLALMIRWFSYLNQMGRKSVELHEYRCAERRLRKAVAEHYRGLEVLNKYRMLNLAGFRKALEKYEKITKISVLEAYMKQKIQHSAFASGAMVCTMLGEMEHHFATRFECGDRKRARTHLRVEQLPKKKPFFTTFRSGLWLGLAVPAIAGGSYLSFQEHVRASLPTWNILLFIYSIFIVPVLLSFLIGINILVWKCKRISYAFIFELNPRSRLDHHQYFELPSLLLCTLAYAFWFSLAQFGQPMLWPLIWLVLTVVIIFNPIRGFMWGRARWWAIKNIAKLGASGMLDVRFTDVWLGDQCCSLVYSFSNLYFVGCFYTRFVNHLSISDHQVLEAWSMCGVTQNWRCYYLLSIFPFLTIHIINAGKYTMAMITYFCYYHWRHLDSPHTGTSYILWCFAATVNSIYACIWDFLMDWSVCKPHARYPLLRTELVYKSQVPCYYFALVSNLCVRFAWVTNIYISGANTELFSFIVALLEMLRRVQWNFFRLENQHISNMDRYQVTREIPLPYRFAPDSGED